MKDLTIIQWELNPRYGLNISYELGGDTYFLIPEKWITTTFLMDAGLIENRRIVLGMIEVLKNGRWLCYSEYCSKYILTGRKAKEIAIRHEENKVFNCVRVEMRPITPKNPELN